MVSESLWSIWTREAVHRGGPGTYRTRGAVGLRVHRGVTLWFPIRLAEIEQRSSAQRTAGGSQHISTSRRRPTVGRCRRPMAKPSRRETCRYSCASDNDLVHVGRIPPRSWTSPRRIFAPPRRVLVQAPESGTSSTVGSATLAPNHRTRTVGSAGNPWGPDPVRPRTRSVSVHRGPLWPSCFTL